MGGYDENDDDYDLGYHCGCRNYSSFHSYRSLKDQLRHVTGVASDEPMLPTIDCCGVDGVANDVE